MLREAKLTDIPEIYKLWCELLDLHQSHHPVFHYNYDAAQILKVDLANRFQDANTRIFVAEGDNSELCGFIISHFRVISEGFILHRKGYIAETFIKENNRQIGLGKELFNAAKSWLLDFGADHIELQVSVNNEKGLKFWERLGFITTTNHLVLTL